MNINNNLILQTYDPDDLIQKSRPILIPISTPLSLNERKIFDFYLSKINSHMPDNYTVRVEKSELEKILGVKYITNQDLNKFLKGLLNKKIFLEDIVSKENKSDVGGGINVMAEATMRKDAETGRQIITLSASHVLWPYIFNIESLGYVKYRAYILPEIKSLYTYNLFTYILANRWRMRKNKKYWDEGIETFYDFMGVEGDYMRTFNRFKEKVLNPSIKALANENIFNISYEVIKPWKKSRDDKVSFA